MSDSSLLLASNPPRLDFPEQLPVCARREDIALALTTHQVVIVCGETGSGKTTQLPKIALAAGRGRQGRIGITQPRRIAARSVAQRLAAETATRLGEFIGWQVRFHDQVGAASRIKVMTDGILLAETRSDPEFLAYDTLILDEAHERSLNIDFLLGYLKLLLPHRPTLRLIVSSATLEAERFSAYFDAAPVIEVSGRTYPVEVRWRPPARPAAGHGAGKVSAADTDKDSDLEDILAVAIDELAGEAPGDILVFLPGEREIRDAHAALRKQHPPHTEILPLFARLSVSEQERVFQPHNGRRIVLATNVAETSLTVPGIRYVVDSGLARIKRYSLRNKIEQLRVEPISQASARQRTGRCGRLADGVCIRLYDEASYLGRSTHTTPEILRSSLAAVILKMRELNLPDIEAFPFLDPPEPRRIRDGQALLHELNALDDQGRLTTIGHQLARLQVDPRLGRMIVAARAKAVLHEVLVIAAFLSVQDPRERPLDRQESADQRHRRFADPRSDFVAILRLWNHLDALIRHRKSRRKLQDGLRDQFLSPARVREWREVHGQLATQVKELGWKPSRPQPASTVSTDDVTAVEPASDQAPLPDYAALHQALLTGLLGNLGMLSEDGSYLGARGTRFHLFPGSGVRSKPKWVMAAEIVETRRVYARGIARIEPEWIEEAGRHLLRLSYADPHWSKRPAQVVAALRATLYGLPVINGRRTHFGPIDPARARAIFIRAALVEGDYATRAGFHAHNRKVIEEIEEASHRARDARLAVDEERLYTWFDDRIPESIHNGTAFEAWLRETSTKTPRLLHLRREDLLGDRRVDADAFPAELDLGGVRLAFTYRFEPGADDDGVTLLLPLAALNQIPERRCEWLVPGLLEEKLAALIKTLPQNLRRAFIPVPTFAHAARQALAPPDARTVRDVEPLTEALAGFLQRITGVAIPPESWRPDALPRHLRMNYRVFDDHDRILAEGRDLADLRQRLGGDARRAMEATVFPGERDTVDRWDFGDLPEHVTVDSGGHRLLAFPAIEETAGGVRLRLLDSPATARRTHRRGVCRLLWRSFPELLRGCEREIGGRLKGSLMHAIALFGAAAPAGLAESLVADILFSAARTALAGDPADLRSQNGFASAAQTARPSLVEHAREAARLVAECLQHARAVAAELARLPRSPATTDMEKQLAGLIFPTFVADIEPGRLTHLPRYLRAMERRLEKLARNPQRDAESLRTLTPLLNRWQARLQREEAAGGITAAVEDFGWQLQELRVSLFAQELKTTEPVSVKRLDLRWTETFG